MSIQQIARNLKMHRRTVRQFVQATEFPERCSSPVRANQQHPFEAYLRQRWAAGCHNAAQLFRELQERGFTGSQSALRRYLLAWHNPLPEALQDRRGRKGEAVAPPVSFSARTTAWLLLGYAKSKDTRQHRVTEAFVETLKTICPTIEQAQEWALQFFTLLRERQGAQLKTWIEKVSSSDLAELKSFARGLASDYEAVFAGVSTEVSNGQTEGQVNRLKLIKRTMDGRANFDLLKARVLPRRAAA